MVTDFKTFGSKSSNKRYRIYELFVNNSCINSSSYLLTYSLTSTIVIRKKVQEKEDRTGTGLREIQPHLFLSCYKFSSLGSLSVRSSPYELKSGSWEHWVRFIGGPDTGPLVVSFPTSCQQPKDGGSWVKTEKTTVVTFKGLLGWRDF